MVKFLRVFSLFRFRLPTLFFLAVIAAILLGWWQDHQRMRGIIYELQNPGPRWDTDQVTGPPDTLGSGDIATAWASTTPDTMREWLVLAYKTPVLARSIQVHETYNPGAVDRVAVFRDDGTEMTVWSGTDPTPRTALRGISEIPIIADFPVDRVKVYLNSPAVPGWNEIDAVALVDRAGKKQWVEKAYASSSFGRNRELPAWYEK